MTPANPTFEQQHRAPQQSWFAFWFEVLINLVAVVLVIQIALAVALTSLYLVARGLYWAYERGEIIPALLFVMSALAAVLWVLLGRSRSRVRQQS